MEVLDFPDFGGEFFPSNCDANIMSNSSMDISSINNSQQVSENPGEGWEVTYKFGVLSPDDARAVKSLLQKLRGHKNAVTLIDTTYSHLMDWPTSLRTDGIGQYGLALNVKNCPTNSLIAKRQMRFKLGEQVHELTDDAYSNASGKCTLQLANEIRNPVPDNQTIITDLNQLRITCRWADPKQIRQFKGVGRLYRSITLDFVEKR